MWRQLQPSGAERIVGRGWHAQGEEPAPQASANARLPWACRCSRGAWLPGNRPSLSRALGTHGPWSRQLGNWDCGYVVCLRLQGGSLILRAGAHCRLILFKAEVSSGDRRVGTRFGVCGVLKRRVGWVGWQVGSPCQPPPCRPSMAGPSAEAGCLLIRTSQTSRVLMQGFASHTCSRCLWENPGRLPRGGGIGAEPAYLPSSDPG